MILVIVVIKIYSIFPHFSKLSVLSFGFLKNINEFIEFCTRNEYRYPCTFLPNFLYSCHSSLYPLSQILPTSSIKFSGYRSHAISFVIFFKPLIAEWKPKKSFCVQTVVVPYIIYFKSEIYGGKQFFILQWYIIVETILFFVQYSKTFSTYLGNYCSSSLNCSSKSALKILQGKWKWITQRCFLLLTMEIAIHLEINLFYK